MIDMFDLYRRFMAENNTHQGGHVRPVENYEQWVQSIQMEIYEAEVAKWQKEQRVTDALRPFLKTISITVNNTGNEPYGIIAYPAGYEHFSAARVLVVGSGQEACGCVAKDSAVYDGDSGKCVVQENGDSTYQDPDDIALMKYKFDSRAIEKGLTRVPQSRWAAVLDRVKKPDITKGFITQFEGGFKLMPKNIGVVIMDCIVKPNKVKFAYTVGAQDQIIYDEANSIQLQWSETLVPEFLARLSKKYGKNIKDQAIYTMGESERQVLGK